MAVKVELKAANENGDVVLEGWIPIEYLELGFPTVQKSKVKSHTALLLRTNPAWLVTRKPVHVIVTIKKTGRKRP